MKTIYEILQITTYNNNHCAFTSSYKKAVDYVLANTEHISGLKIGEEWLLETSLPKQYKGEIKLFTGYGACSTFSGFIIKKHRII